MRARGGFRRLAACLAVVSLLGWLELPSEHIHTTADADHAVEHVHRHFALHERAAADHHDRPDVELFAADGPEGDHPEVYYPDDPIYLAAQAAELSRIEVPAAPLVAALVDPRPLSPALVRTWLTPPLHVHVHAPPWGRQYARRGPPPSAA